jgi:hypothetical protein
MRSSDPRRSGNPTARAGHVGLGRRVAAGAVWLAAACPLVGAGEAVEPGRIAAKPTWCCMGLTWPYAGDENRNASVAAEYRRPGARDWRPAFRLWRHEYGGVTMFAGSVFRLAPGTGYEFRLSLSDPDGGGAVRTVSAATLAYPRMPARAVKVDGGLVEAQRRAAPGTVMLLSKGTYPGARLTTSGRPGEWIVYKAAGDGEVVIDGRIEIRANYVWLDGLTVRAKQNAIQGSHKGVCITRCRLTAHYAIHTGRGGENYFIADNVLTGDAAGKFSFSGEGVDFGSDRGQCGHAVCFNELTEFADGVSYGRGDIDVYGNYIHETVDDFVEPDYARANYRVWDNRCYNSMCGFSFQPMKGGPWYFLHNVNVGTYLHALKVKSITGPSVICGNTMLTKSSRLGQGADVLRGLIVNNAWLRMTEGPLASGGRFRPGASGVRLDHNAYGTGGADPFSSIPYAQLAATHGWDTHSVRVDWREVFREPVRAPSGRPYYSSKLQGKVIPKDWHFEHVLLLPKPGSKLIDAGTVLPNLTGPYLGKAPDLGAHELGLGTAWYGPRTWDEQAGLIYGLPEGWRKVLPGAAAKHADLGCPEAKDADALLACASPRSFAWMRVEPARGEARWRQARALVGSDQGAQTDVLEFQDGLYARLYRRGPNAALLAGRVEPEGVLHVHVGCRQADLARARLRMFQLVRSLVR